MGQILSWGTDSLSNNIKFQSFFETWRFIKVLAITCYWNKLFNPAIFWPLIVKLYFNIIFFYLHVHLQSSLFSSNPDYSFVGISHAFLRVIDYYAIIISCFFYHTLPIIIIIVL
jgi:hypothetical protein